MGFFKSMFGNNCNNHCNNQCNPCGQCTTLSCYDQTPPPCSTPCNPCTCYVEPDIVLTSKLNRPEPTQDLEPLPLKQTTCNYVLDINDGTVTVLQSNRVLCVKGSVRGEVKIIVQKGTDTPRVFDFIDTEILLKENLKQGDKITFLYGAGSDSHITLTASIKYKCYYN